MRFNESVWATAIFYHFSEPRAKKVENPALLRLVNQKPRLLCIYSVYARLLFHKKYVKLQTGHCSLPLSFIFHAEVSNYLNAVLLSCALNLQYQTATCITSIRRLSLNTNVHARPTTSTSVLLCPMLHTIAPFFILSICSRVITFLLP